MLRAPLCLLLLFLAPASRAAAQEPAPVTWFTEYDLAAEAAQAANKDLLVSFRGSDWCEFCAALEEEVFSLESWKKVAAKDFILVALDFPQGEEARKLVPDAERNTQLADGYSVTQFPTVLLMNSSGVVFGELGYEEGGVDRYLQLMAALQSTGKRIMREAAEIRSLMASSEDIVPLVERSVNLLTQAVQGTQGLPELAEWARLAYELDGKTELRTRAVRAVLLAGQGDQADFPVAIRLDPENQLGLNERAAIARMDAIRTEVHANEWVDHVLSLRKMPRLHNAQTVQELAVYAAVFCRDYLERLSDGKSLASWAKTLGPIPVEFEETIQDLLKEEAK